MRAPGVPAPCGNRFASETKGPTRYPWGFRVNNSEIDSQFQNPIRVSTMVWMAVLMSVLSQAQPPAKADPAGLNPPVEAPASEPATLPGDPSETVPVDAKGTRETSAEMAPSPAPEPVPTAAETPAPVEAPIARDVPAKPDAPIPAELSKVAEVPEEERPLETITTASRAVERLDQSPVAVEVVTRQEIERSGARNVSDVLAAQPGLEMRTSVSGTTFALQGLSSQYTLVLVDGERITGRLNGEMDLSRMNADDIEQIEIVKGPSSVMYGSDAIAGAINIVTRKGQRPLSARATASYGSMNQLQLDGTTETRHEKWGARISGNYSKRDPYSWTTSALNDSTTGSSNDAYQFSARADTTLHPRLKIEVRGDTMRRIQRGVDATLTGATFDRATQDESQELTLLPTVKIGKDTELSFTGHHSRFKHRYVLDQRNSSTLDSVQETVETLFRVGTQLDTSPGKPHRLVVGTEALFEALDSDRLVSGTGSRNRLSVYAQDTWRILEKRPLSVVPGMRYDRDSQFGSAYSPRLAARFDPFERLTVRASYGLAFKAPTFQQLLINFENPTVGYRVDGNPNLQPERSRGGNAGVEFTATKRTLFWTSVYQNDLRDMIAVTTEITPEGQRFNYGNLARVRIRGMDVGVKQTLPGNFSVDVSYTFIDSEDISGGRLVPGQTPHRLTGQVAWRHRAWGLETSLRGAMNGKRPFYLETDGSTSWADPFATLDARIGKTVGSKVTVFVAGSNLFNAGDAVYLPIAPRSLFGGISAQL